GPMGEGLVLRVQDGVAHRSVLSGTVTRSKGKGAGTTSLGTIEGLGQFGDVRVTLSSPTFTVRQYPFFLSRGRVLSTTRPTAPGKKGPATPARHPRVAPRQAPRPK